MELRSCWVFPFGLYGVNGHITSYELDQPDDARPEIPLLISNTVQRKLRVNIELGDNKAGDRICFRAWGEDHYGLMQTPNGNPASSLLDFPSEGHPGVKGLDKSECYTVVLEPTYDSWDGGDGKAQEADATEFQMEAVKQQQKEDDARFSDALKGVPTEETDVVDSCRRAPAQPGRCGRSDSERAPGDPQQISTISADDSLENNELLAERRVTGVKQLPLYHDAVEICGTWSSGAL